MDPVNCLNLSGFIECVSEPHSYTHVSRGSLPECNVVFAVFKLFNTFITTSLKPCCLGPSPYYLIFLHVHALLFPKVKILSAQIKSDFPFCPAVAQSVGAWTESLRACLVPEGEK